MNEPDYKEHIKIINGLSNAVMKENQSMQVSHWLDILGYFELVSISNREKSSSRAVKNMKIWLIFNLVNIFVADIPSQVPPLTPGTNKKMAEALKATFASWEKEQLRLGVPKGNNSLLTNHYKATIVAYRYWEILLNI